MTKQTITRAAATFALVAMSFTGTAGATVTDPTRALLGQVESRHTTAISALADPQVPSGAVALLNRSGAALVQKVPSLPTSARDRESQALLGRIDRQ